MKDLPLNKSYNSFSEHPLAPLYFKYIDILISKDLNYNVQYLLDVASAPLTPENLDVITKVISDIEILLKDNFDDFDAIAELRAWGAMEQPTDLMSFCCS